MIEYILSIIGILRNSIQIDGYLLQPWSRKQRAPTKKKELVPHSQIFLGVYSRVLKSTILLISNNEYLEILLEKDPNLWTNIHNNLQIRIFES